MNQNVLIAGIGNIFLGDDAFGVEVVRNLVGRLPASARVADFGIRGFDLAYALMESLDLAILVDAAPRGGLPGTLYAIEPELPKNAVPEQGSFEGHSITLEHVFRLVRALGGSLPRLLILGCEPTPLSSEEQQFGRAGLSGAVQASVPVAMRVIESLVTEFLELRAPLRRISDLLQAAEWTKMNSFRKEVLA